MCCRASARLNLPVQTMNISAMKRRWQHLEGYSANLGNTTKNLHWPRQCPSQDRARDSWRSTELASRHQDEAWQSHSWQQRSCTRTCRLVQVLRWLPSLTMWPNCENRSTVLRASTTAASAVRQKKRAGSKLAYLLRCTATMFNVLAMP